MSRTAIPAWLIQQQTIWKCQIAWGQISFLLGVLGNIFTLYATTPHNAIKLDKMSIWIIKNLAVADICNCFLVVLPILIYQYGKISQNQIYGEAYNEILTICKYGFFVANLFFVNILSLNKLLRCLFPLRNLVPTRRQKLIVTVATAGFAIVPSIWFAYGIKAKLFSVWKVSTLNERNYLGAAQLGYVGLNVNEMTHLQGLLYWCMIGILNALPCATMIIINTVLVAVAVVKTRSTINKTNILMIVLVTLGFLVSILPHFVDLVLDDGTIRTVRKEIAWSITYLSIWINPFIYLAVNPSYRKFTAGKISFWKKNQQVGNTSLSGAK